MKISLAWIFDHIDAHWKKQDVQKVVQKFNEVTAEIEHFKKININLINLFLAKVEDKKVFIPELKKEVSLETREGVYFLVYQEGKDYKWATCRDVDLEKDGLLPEFSVDDEKKWRDCFENEDVILDVDNKSLTHRPDMWGHRGFAREIAAYLGYPFLDKKDFLDFLEIQNFDKKSKASDKTPFIIEIKADKSCKRFSGLYIDAMSNKPSNLFIASRLIKVGIRPINGIVDLTNYVMLDWSQPVHAYDANKIADKKLVARMAKKGEKLTLLDDQELELRSEDLVIADGKKAVGLAGVMGGSKNSISGDTTSVFFESASFEAVNIRRTSLFHGIRTDSSTRFEKTLDPNQITDAILRFVHLAKQYDFNIEITGEIICVGKPFVEQTIGVTHSFMESRLGIKLKREEVVEPLTKLGFTVVDTEQFDGDDYDILYTITIPSYRGSKDVSIKEDILEEIIRFFGFNKIALNLPALKKEPRDLTPILRLREIQEYLAHTARMTEQKNYIYSDEDFLNEIGVQFDNCVEIDNPVSENNYRLTPSLLPNLYKNIKHNIANEDFLRFFEYGRVFHLKKDTVVEEKKLNGVWFNKRTPIDFYEIKTYVMDLCKMCGMHPEFKKVEAVTKEHPWLMPYQTAEIFVEGTRIGILGKLQNSFLAKLDALPESEGFFFDLDAERLISYAREEVVYAPISKFQETTFDLCFMIPLSVQVADLKAALFDSDDLIARVDLVDFFDKEDWVDKRSVAFRLWVNHPEKTLEKEEIDNVRDNAIKRATKRGVELRSV